MATVVPAPEELTVDVNPTDPNHCREDEAPSASTEDPPKDVGDHADDAMATLTDAADAHDDAAKKAADIVDLANRVEQGQVDPNAAPAEDGAVAAASKDVTGALPDSAAHCSHVRGFVEIFGTIMEAIVAPVAGPSCMFWVHKALVAFSVVFFIVNLGVLLHTVANTTITDIELKHEKTVLYPDIYVCMPAYSNFYSFKCCSDACTSTSSGCKNAGFLNLALENSAEGCPLGLFPGHDLGMTAATSCPFTAGSGRKGMSDWTTYPSYVQKYAGATSSTFARKKTGTTNYVWPEDAWATGLEERMPSFTPSSSDQITITTTSGTFAAGDLITGSTSEVTATVVVRESATSLVIKEASCPSNNCNTYFTANEAITVAGGAAGTFVSGTSPKGYRMRDTTYYPVCMAFRNNAATIADATFNLEQNYVQMAFAATMTKNILQQPPTLVAFLMESGKIPYAASPSKEILATKIPMPGYGNAGVGTISYDKVMDTSQGETDWTINYDVDTISYAIRQQNIIGTKAASNPEIAEGTNIGYAMKDSLSDPVEYFSESYGDSDGLIWGVVSFTISNFVVREITIRDHTISEVWAAIGGLWSGSILILCIFFSASDIPDAKHRLFQVFNWTCPSVRDEWLAAAEEEGSRDANAAAAELAKQNFIKMYQELKGSGELEDMQLGVKTDVQK